MKNFKIGAIEYSIGVMPAMRQLQVTRRLAGALGDAISPELVENIRAMPKEEMALPMMRVVGRAVGKLSDADFEYVIDTCLDATARGNGNGAWFPLRQNGVLMYQDLTAADMLQITINVLVEKLSSFIPALLGDLISAPPQTDASSSN